VEVKSNNYSVYIGKDVLEDFNSILEDCQGQYSNIFIFCDENSAKHCLPHLIGQVPMLIGSELIEIESGEQNKTLSICQEVWETIGESKADRKAIFVNLGGGVVCDMGGMIASLYKRGIKFFHIPTTLLAQVDASIGGKLAVDQAGHKNQIGLFRNPDIVLVDPEFLSTLPERQWLSGLAEVLKHALIADADYWTFLASLDLKNEEYLSALLHKSIEIKNAIVLQDWEEKGLRKTLNFGHTIGHALESNALENKKNLLHGEAVAIGLAVETILSEMKNKLSQQECSKILSRLKEVFNLEPIKENEFSDLIEWMRHDKKNDSAQINFTLLNKIGQADYNKTVSENVIEEAMYRYNSFLNESL
jgi:3-dehydroquinate synthase